MADVDLTEGTAFASTAGFYWGRNETQTALRTQDNRRSKKAAVGTGTGESNDITGGFPASSQRVHAVVRVDHNLLDRAGEILEDVDASDPEGMCSAIEALRCAVSNLWTEVAESDQYHQSLLAMIEAFLLSQEQLTLNQTAALRGAFRDLASMNLDEAYLDVIRSRFIDEGHKPLAILSELESADGDDAPR